MRIPMLIGFSLILAASPTLAQSRASQSATSTVDGQDDEQAVVRQQRPQAPLQTNPSGRTARSSVGQVGERQTRDAATQQLGIKPMARIVSRIQNRVQNRIRNRIDRFYDGRANATDPFVVAGDEARKSGRPR